jgi:hypothetical protein
MENGRKGNNKSMFLKQNPRPVNGSLIWAEELGILVVKEYFVRSS